LIPEHSDLLEYTRGIRVGAVSGDLFSKNPKTFENAQLEEARN
jgi:hypothetical protein